MSSNSLGGARRAQLVKKPLWSWGVCGDTLIPLQWDPGAKHRKILAELLSSLWTVVCLFLVELIFTNLRVWGSEFGIPNWYTGFKIPQDMALCWCQHFLPEINIFCYIKKYRYRLHFYAYFLILSTLFEFIKVVLKKVISVLIMLAKLATLGLLKKSYFKIKFLPHNFCPWRPNKFYSVTHIIMEIWSCDQILVNLAFLKEKLS